MEFSEALKKYSKDIAVSNLNNARLACRKAKCLEEEYTIFLKLLDRLKSLSGKPIVLGV